MTKSYARIIGVLYFLFFLMSILGGRLLGGLVVQSDAAATANHILTHESLFRLGTAMGLVAIGFYVALLALFYDLFRPVNWRVSLLAAFFGLVGCAIQAGGSVFDFFSLVVLRSGQAGGQLKAEELPGLALLFLKLGDRAVSVALVFFAVYCLLIGCLILRATFLPRFLGAMMVLAGLGWLTFLYAPLASHLSPYIEALGIVAEASLMLWLLVMGVKTERWQEQASAVGMRT
jgi:MFS family permease